MEQVDKIAFPFPYAQMVHIVLYSWMLLLPFVLQVKAAVRICSTVQRARARAPDARAKHAHSTRHQARAACAPAGNDAIHHVCGLDRVFRPGRRSRLICPNPSLLAF